MVPASGNPNDALGFVVSYSLRVKLNLGTLGGELQADLPFKLVHPGPGKFTWALIHLHLHDKNRSVRHQQEASYNLINCTYRLYCVQMHLKT